MNTAADSTARAQCAALSVSLRSNSFLRSCVYTRVDGSDLASFDGVVLCNFVAQVRVIRFSDFGVSGGGLAEGRV